MLSLVAVNEFMEQKYTWCNTHIKVLKTYSKKDDNENRTSITCNACNFTYD